MEKSQAIAPSASPARERPLRFTLRDHVFEVADVEDRWYSPGATFFRVRLAAGATCCDGSKRKRSG